MDKYIKQLTPLLYALLVILVFSVSGVAWAKVKDKYFPTTPGSNADKNGSATTQIPRDVKKISDNDPVRGNKKAKYALIEYSDYDCPFCKDFHTTVKELVAENTEFKWIFRQFPLAQLHPNATDKAKAGICVFNVSGNEKFWEFSDKLYENQDIAVADLKKTASSLGVDTNKYEDCLKDFDSEYFNITFELARSMNVTGTPTTVIVNTDNGNATLAVGALSKEDLIQKAKQLD